GARWTSAQTRIADRARRAGRTGPYGGAYAGACHGTFCHGYPVVTERRYLVLTELFLPTKGGTAVWFGEVYRRLGGKGVHIVPSAVPGDRAHAAKHPNAVHRLDLRRHPWLRPSSLPMYLRLFLHSLHLGLTHRFEAVHAGRVLPE